MEKSPSERKEMANRTIDSFFVIKIELELEKDEKSRVCV